MICLGCNHTCYQRHKLSDQTIKIWYFFALFVVFIASTQYIYLDFYLKDNHLSKAVGLRASLSHGERPWKVSRDKKSEDHYCTIKLALLPPPKHTSACGELSQLGSQEQPQSVGAREWLQDQQLSGCWGSYAANLSELFPLGNGDE